MALPFLKGIEGFTKGLKGTSGFRIEPWPVFILGLVILLTAFVFMPANVSLALSLALFLAPVWLPALLVAGAWLLWVIWRRSEFIAKQKFILLEIKPPRNLVKTPLAMETFFTGIFNGSGEGTWYLKYIKGSVRPWWSLEIASFEGDVHFYIWTRVGLRRIIEAQLYAQYPGVQIVEAVDYTRLVSATPEEWGVWGCDFVATGKDPVPIKTYVEYGLDKVQKEPEQVDPLANMIEFMGSMKKGENLWLQIIIRTHKGEKYHRIKDDGKVYDWKDEAKEMVKKIREDTRMPYVDPATGKEVPGFPNPTKGQMEQIAAIERNVTKPAYDVGMRGVYIVENGKFDVAVIGGLTGMFKQFSAENWNGFKPSGWLAPFDDYPWEIGTQKLKDKIKVAMIETYRRRQFFYPPFSFGVSADEGMVMSTEELATIYHVPSQAVSTPSLERIQSATSEAPANLPL